MTAVDVFRLRAWARAYLVAAGVLDLAEAIDVLMDDAERDGLVNELGQEALGSIVTDAFLKVSGGATP